MNSDNNEKNKTEIPFANDLPLFSGECSNVSIEIGEEFDKELCEKSISLKTYVNINKHYQVITFINILFKLLTGFKIICT